MRRARRFRYGNIEQYLAERDKLVRLSPDKIAQIVGYSVELLKATDRPSDSERKPPSA